jgi:hypothetical protein
VIEERRVEGVNAGGDVVRLLTVESEGTSPACGQFG